jgi:hexosaminidase
LAAFLVVIPSKDDHLMNAPVVSIIPQPKSVRLDSGFFQIKSDTQIAADAQAQGVASYLAHILRPATGFALPIKAETPGINDSNTITLAIDSRLDNLGPEGYELVISPEHIRLRASQANGLFYGVQTLRLLLPAAIEATQQVARVDWTIPAVTITDSPRFSWRGLHLDVGRHMYPVSFIKKYLDVMALHKYNTFHWHLTEDQGWRIEIKQYLQLTTVGSQRAATPIPADRNQSDGKPYGGYYTREEIKDVVAYARERFITVVPEIEMPGHAVAALASYPELGCRGEGYQVRTTWGIAKDVFCAGNDEVFTFLENVLTEVLALFPSQYIHIGGDECPKERWQSCPKCQARIQSEGLANEHELQSYFIRRIERWLNVQDRRLIGWDEILEGGLAPNATVMSWRGNEGGIEAANAGHDVVMTPTTHCYLDYYQSQDQDNEPPAIGHYLPLERVYGFNPIPPAIAPDKAHHVLGAQGNVWTEYIPTEQQVEYMAYPRATALAEVVWSDEAGRDYDEFLSRLASHLKRLDSLDVNYRPLDRGVNHPSP